MKKRHYMTRDQIDRALVKLFAIERHHMPRVLFPINLYSYTQALFAKTKKGRAYLTGRGRPK